MQMIIVSVDMIDIDALRHGVLKNMKNHFISDRIFEILHPVFGGPHAVAPDSDV
jgi:hypothetical protein